MALIYLYIISGPILKRMSGDNCADDQGRVGSGDA